MSKLPLEHQAVGQLHRELLPNGLPIELVVSQSPLGFDVAVCSTDKSGSAGPLNRLVFDAAVYDLRRLGRVFQAPASLIRGRRMPVLVVQTIPGLDDRHADQEAFLISSLRHGLTLLEGVTPRRRVWLPLLGTGSGGLSFQQSFRATVSALSDWNPGSTEVVTVAVPDERVLEQVIAVTLDQYTESIKPISEASTQPTLPHDEPTDLNPMKPHVAWALSIAEALSLGQPVRPVHVAKAIVLLDDRIRSSAFVTFRSLARLEPDAAKASIDLDARRSLAVDPAHLSDDFRRRLHWAQGTQGAPRFGSLWGRHLVTAVLLSADDELAAELERNGTPLDTVRDRWYRFVTRKESPEKRAHWDAWWAAAHLPLPGRRRAGHVTETDQGEDMLGVEAEAGAFARLILDERIQPPLSIGLLGDWGSGKSFFIEQIKKQIEQLKGSPGLFQEVVEIEFNAWHASDANLWASLVTHIFDEIWDKVALENSDEARKKARDQLVHAIAGARGALREAEDQVEAARTALIEAEDDLANRRRALAWDRHVKNVSLRQLTSLAEQAGLRDALTTINDLESAAHDLSSSSRRLGLMFNALLERPLTNVALPTGLLLLLTGATWMASQHAELLPSWFAEHQYVNDAAKLITAITGVLGALVAPLSVASRHLARFGQMLAKVRSEYDTAVATADDTTKREIATARLELDSAEDSVLTARKRLADLMNQQVAFDPGRRLSTFLQDRVASTTYRAQQGIISLVHRDFQQLSERMREWRTARLTPQTDLPAIPADIKPFDRIVIYVDDLDRCRPQQVVQMLEAVHLLLALDLFVVVVAVDSRWLTRALQVHYKDLLAADEGAGTDEGLRRSTAQNYLEKIFQVTYALGPMDPSKFGDYVRFLAGADGERPARAAAASTTPSSAAPSPPARTALSQAPARSSKGAPIPADATSLAPSSGDALTPSGIRVTASHPAPHAIHIDAREREFLTRLAPLLPTPRLAKRLVNAYRLVKAMKDPDALDDYDRSERHRATLVMLAILFGHPAIAPDLFRSLHEAAPPFDTPTEKLADVIRRVSAVASGRDETAVASASALSDAAEWQTLASQLDHIAIDLTIEDAAAEPAELARYSLVTGHDWHVWKARPTAVASPASLAKSR
jgi:hypothetical protein